ncbi:hypothetical protein NIE88_14480 [Sporolactobacillus shoreicorticis]|uniref:Spore coat protein n=1 Tax=Sporolactobacillus shoreicorticis TaxID=1923877 RepID=A0ABW5S0T7_9BACL|nr:hypothetical protein [Sporolactobacillus shoreicorticis]MCO7126975.1 hypothetical protein [Sporolactobacillus shoreicorticis]
MGWNNFVYGQQSSCGYGGNSYGNQYDKGCDGSDLLEGVSKNDFIKVFLKSSCPVEGFFAGVSKNVLTLFECGKHKISTIDICLDDVVAVKSFGPRFDFDDDRHDDHCGCK